MKRLLLTAALAVVMSMPMAQSFAALLVAKVDISTQ